MSFSSFLGGLDPIGQQDSLAALSAESGHDEHHVESDERREADSCDGGAEQQQRSPREKPSKGGALVVGPIEDLHLHEEPAHTEERAEGAVNQSVHSRLRAAKDQVVSNA